MATMTVVSEPGVYRGSGGQLLDKDRPVAAVGHWTIDLLQADDDTVAWHGRCELAGADPLTMAEQHQSLTVRLSFPDEPDRTFASTIIVQDIDAATLAETPVLLFRGATPLMDVRDSAGLTPRGPEPHDR